MGKGGVGLQASVCLEEFENYLMNVKKASANTLSSYVRDVRQLNDYLVLHELPELTHCLLYTSLSAAAPPRPGMTPIPT